jgi:hypothetical protein
LKASPILSRFTNGVRRNLDRAVERGGVVVEWGHMRGVRENGELAVRDVLIDLDGVLVTIVS